MKSYIEAIDKTRPITVGDNNPYGLRYNTYGDFRNKVTAVLANNGEGLAGANYSMAAMSGIHSAHPDWKIIATETASPSNSRGIYTTLSQYGKSGDYQCTAYDTNAVSWEIQHVNPGGIRLKMTLYPVNLSGQDLIILVSQHLGTEQIKEVLVVTNWLYQTPLTLE